MQYKLIKSPIPFLSAIEQVLQNRGIEIKDIKNQINADWNCVNSQFAFPKQKLQEAAKMLLTTIKQGKDIIVVVDCDCDGYTSAALLINCLFDWFPEYTLQKVHPFLHEEKIHGLSDLEFDIPNVGLIICPDGASNDQELHKKQTEEGIQILVLDHHEAPYDSPYACVINNQLCDQPNKQLSGVGVVYQFCSQLDALGETNFAQKYLDLVALGLTADMMSMLEPETKFLISEGFKLQHIKDPFIDYMVEKNDQSLKGKVTPIGAAFYIAPFINAITRSGTPQEQRLIFSSMLYFEAFQEIPSTKRGHKPNEMETVVQQAIRTATNVKNRQTKKENDIIPKLIDLIEENDMLEEHKALVFLLEEGSIDKNIAGLAANKIMANYQRPCCILIDYGDYQAGSARGFATIGLEDFKQVCQDTKLVNYAEGHKQAFGLSVPKDKIQDFIAAIDNSLKDIIFEKSYKVDFIYQENENFNLDVLEIAENDNLWGKDIDEPFIAIENVTVKKDNIELKSKEKNPTIVITLPNHVELIKFSSSEEEQKEMINKKITFIGRCGENKWNGATTPQIKIENYEILSAIKKTYVF